MIPYKIPDHRAISFTGWIKWAPVLAAPFALLFFETWMTVQMRLNDYRVSEIKQRLRQSSQALYELRGQAAGINTEETLAMKAPEYGFRQADPSQLEVIYYSPAPGVEESAFPLAPYDVASRQVARP